MRKVLAVLVIAFGHHAASSRVWLSISETWSNQNYLPPGQTASFLFDLTSQIPVDETFVQPYAVQSGHISFAFSSPSFPVYQAGPLYAEYNYTSGSPFSPSYTRTATTYYSDALDSASVQLGSQAFNLDDSANYSSVSNFTGGRFDGSSCSFITCSYYYTDSYNAIAGYAGNFGVSQSLGNVVDLDHGTIAATVMNTGSTNLYFSTGTLDVVLTPNPVPIPEPAGCLLLGTGLLAMALKKRGMACIGKSMHVDSSPWRVSSISRGTSGMDSITNPFVTEGD